MAAAFNILNSIPMDVEDVKNLYFSGSEYENVRSRIREIITKLRIVEYDLEQEAARLQAAGRRRISPYTRRVRRRHTNDDRS